MFSKLGIKLDMSRFFQSPFNIYLANFFPRKLYRLYFIHLGMAYLLFRKDIRTRISSSIRMIFGVNIDFLRLLMLKRDIFFGLVDHYFEKMWNIYSPLEEYCDYIKKHTSIENRTWLDDSIKKRHGVLLISGHFGGIEYMTITLSVHGFSPVIIARFRTKILLEKTLPRAKETNIEVINADEPNVFFRAVRALKEGKILITLCDEFSHWSPCKNRSIEVFGECFCQDKTLDVFHNRVKVPTCLGLMRRGKKQYKLEIYPIPFSEEPKNESIGKLTWKLLEKFIIQDPGQWYQWHEMVDTLASYKQKQVKKKLTLATVASAPRVPTL